MSTPSRPDPRRAASLLLPASSPATLAAIAALATHLRSAHDFATPLRAFEALVQRDDFLPACALAESPLLDQIVAQLATRLCGRRARFSWLPALLRHDEGRLVHGAAAIGEYLAIVFHFEAHDVGLVTLTRPGSANVEYARFTAVLAPPGTMAIAQRGAA